MKVRNFAFSNPQKSTSLHETTLFEPSRVNPLKHLTCGGWVSRKVYIKKLKNPLHFTHLPMDGLV